MRWRIGGLSGDGPAYPAAKALGRSDEIGRSTQRVKHGTARVCSGSGTKGARPVGRKVQDMAQTVYPAPVQEAAASQGHHNLILEDRRAMTATGITRIVSYDEYSATLETQQGSLVVGGRELQVSELSIQTGEVKIAGKIESIQYADLKESPAGFFKRLVR